MSAAGLELAEALATIALLHEELDEARKERDQYQRVWHRDANLLRRALGVLDGIANADYRGNMPAEQRWAADAAASIRKDRRR